MVLPMLSRGAEGMDRKAIADACTELKVQGDVMGYTTTADNLVATIGLFGKLFEKSTFPDQGSQSARQANDNHDGSQE